MSNPIESFLRDLIQGNANGPSGGTERGSPQFVNITSAHPELFGLPVNLAFSPGMGFPAGAPGVVQVGRGRGGLLRGRGPPHGGRGSAPGSVYSGEVAPSVWIQREQQRTPLRYTATNGAASFDAVRLREEGNRAFRAALYEEAVDFYTRSIEADPSGELSYSNRSFAYLRLGRIDEAVRDAQETVRLKPSYFKGHYRLGLALTSKGEYLGALASLRRALELAPVENKSEISVAIAKCESKLARTPSTPLITDASSSCCNHSPTTFRVFPSATSPSAPRLDMASLGELVAEAAQLRARFDKYSQEYSSQAAIEECKSRSQKVRQLMSTATSNSLLELSKEAGEKQAALRQTLKGKNRSAYLTAKQERDEAYQQLWSTAGKVKGAIERLKSIAVEEQSFFSRFGSAQAERAAEGGGVSAREEVGTPSTPWQSPAPTSGRSTPQPSGDVAATPTATGPTDPPLPSTTTTTMTTTGPTTSTNTAEAFEALLQRRREISERLAEAQRTFAATDAAGAAFRKALEEEAEAARAVQPLLDEAQRLNAQLENQARHVARTTTKELSDSRLGDLEHVFRLTERVHADEVAFKETLAEGDRLLDEEAKLEGARLACEKQRIQLQAEVEWFKVRDEPEGRIASLQNHVRDVQMRIAETNRKQKEVQKRLLEIIDRDHPELAWKSMSCGSRILRLIKGSGLWMNLTLTDFQIVSTLSSTANSKVYHATRRGEHVALKEISVDDDQAKRRFQREVDIVAGCAHPSIIKIKGVFFDGPFAYIISPYYRSGSMKTLLQKKEPLSWVVVQDMLRQMASGLAYLHEHGIVHGDIKPSNILISDDNRPIITDFGIAKDNGRFGEGVDVTTTATTIGAISGTAQYMAPEQLLGEVRRATCKSDMWSLGITFYEFAAQNAFFHDETLGEPSAPTRPLGASGGAAEIPARRVGGDEKLADLITSMIDLDASRRASAYDVLGHPYFSSSAAPLRSNQNSAALAKSDERIDAVRSFIHAVRTAHPQRILVSVSRGQMVESLSSIFSQIGDSELLEPIMVVFQGEAGIDEGALTSEMLNLFYVQMVREKKALVAAAASEEEMPPADGAASTFMLGTTYLPAEDEKNLPTDLFELLGKVLLKSVVENRPLPLQLNSAVLKYFCDVPVSIMDMEEFDRTVAHTLKRLRLLSSEELEAAELTFADFSVSFLANHLDGRYIRDTLVTSDNVRDYVELRVRYDLIEKRKRALDAMKKGFYGVATIEPHLKLLSPSDLRLLLCGVQHVPPQTIVDALEFQGFDSSSKTPQYLKEILMSMSQNNLRRFLELCTSTAAIPATDTMRKIKVLRTGDTSRLPVGHGCVFQLDLPDYNDKQVLEEKLEVALAHVSDGFHIV